MKTVMKGNHGRPTHPEYRETHITLRAFEEALNDCFSFSLSLNDVHGS